MFFSVILSFRLSVAKSVKPHESWSKRPLNGSLVLDGPRAMSLRRRGVPAWILARALDEQLNEIRITRTGDRFDQAGGVGPLVGVKAIDNQQILNDVTGLYNSETRPLSEFALSCAGTLTPLAGRPLW